MYCANCAAPLTQGLSYCNRCGANLKEKEPIPTNTGAISAFLTAITVIAAIGLGIMFGGDPRGIRVIRFTDDSPAREAGMEIGDLITAIDGVPAGREPLVNWVVNLRGLAGTPVVLEIERGTMPRRQ